MNRPALMLAIMVLAHMLSNAFRTAYAVMAGPIGAEIDLGADTLGLLSGTYSITFALAQIFVGIALDRLGARLVAGSLMLVAALGAAVSATADSATVLILGQALIGIGCAPVLMGGLYLATMWYPAEKFGMLTATMIALGTAGIALAATPLALLVEGAGWRGAYWTLGGLSLLMAGLIALLVRDAPPDAARPAPTETIAEALVGMGRLAADMRMVGLLAVAFLTYPVNLTMRALWVGPYFTGQYAMSQIDMANVALVISLLMVLGPFTIGRLDLRGLPRPAMITTGGIVTSISLLTMAAVAGHGWGLDLALWLTMTAGTAIASLLYASARNRFPVSHAGRALSTLNFSVFIGAAVWPVVTGLILSRLSVDENDPDLVAYRVMFATLGTMVALAAIAYRVTRRAALRKSADEPQPTGPPGPPQPPPT